MTHEMLIGGLMILTMVAGVVLVMTSSRSMHNDRFDEEHDLRKRTNSKRPKGPR